MKPFLLAVFCLAAVTALAGIVDATPSHSSALNADPLSRLVGSAKEAVGDTLFLKADEYFHGGAVHEDHRDDSAEELAHEGLLEKEPGAQAGKDDWIARIHRRIGGHEVMHLTREQRVEMLPFFFWGTELDPHNVEAILTSAFWLDREFNKTAEALRLLEKGLRDNPGSWEIEQALGRIYSRDTARRADAERHLAQAMQKASGMPLEAPERVTLAFDHAEAAYRLGHSKEALASYEAAAALFDSHTAPYLRSTAEEKIKQLRASD